MQLRNTHYKQCSGLGKRDSTLEGHNVSSSTSYKKTLCFCLSLREIKEILTNTFIYETILIQICVNANIINMQIFNFYKYDLKGH